MSGTTAIELLESTRNYLVEQILPQQEGFLAYNTKVAANNLAIVVRELELTASLEKLDDELRLELSLDNPEEPLSVALARALRDGIIECDYRLLTYLKTRSMLTMAIDNPRYSGFRLAQERWKKGDL